MDWLCLLLKFFLSFPTRISVFVFHYVFIIYYNQTSKFSMPSSVVVYSSVSYFQQRTLDEIIVCVYRTRALTSLCSRNHWWGHWELGGIVLYCTSHFFRWGQKIFSSPAVTSPQFHRLERSTWPRTARMSRAIWRKLSSTRNPRKRLGLYRRLQKLRHVWIRKRKQGKVFRSIWSVGYSAFLHFMCCLGWGKDGKIRVLGCVNNFF